MMFLSLFSLAVAADPEADPCNAYNSSCLLCMQHADQCFYCFKEKEAEYQCMSNAMLTEAECTHKTQSTDKKCVEMLGGDAINTNRYIFGAVFLALAITVDLVIRFCSKPTVKEDFAHL